jgi:hypothetical protein
MILSYQEYCNNSDHGHVRKHVLQKKKKKKQKKTKTIKV